MDEIIKPGDMTPREREIFWQRRSAQRVRKERAGVNARVEALIVPIREAQQRAVTECRHSQTQLRVTTPTESRGLAIEGGVEERCTNCNTLIRAAS